MQQTDWSNGPGIYGPTGGFGTTFYTGTEIDCFCNPGALYLTYSDYTEHSVVGASEKPTSVYCADINGDGYLDILGTLEYNGDSCIVWFENVDGTATSWVEHIVDYGYADVYSEDIDGDGDMDVISASGSGGLSWWENSDTSPGIIWTEHIVDLNFIDINAVFAEDMNQDGDMDILGASGVQNDLPNFVNWYENLDGIGCAWQEHTIDATLSGPSDIYCTDINGDGLIDVAGSAFYTDAIIWWENHDSTGVFWTRHDVWYLNGAISVHSGDMNNDGYMDLIGAAYAQDDLCWFGNVNGSGTEWSKHNLDLNYDGASSVYSGDIDGDGKLDILTSSKLNGEVTWWRNYDGEGTELLRYTVSNAVENPCFVFITDINGDNNSDIIAAADLENDILWWEINNGYATAGNLISTVIDMNCDPIWNTIDWTSVEPPGTSVCFQVRASDDPYMPVAWSDTIYTPCSLQGILPDSITYLQYKAILKTSNSAATPALYDITISYNPVELEHGESLEVEQFEFLPFSPNPATGIVYAQFGLPESGVVSLNVYDISGRMLTELTIDDLDQGYHQISLGIFPPGVYLCKMVSGGQIRTQRFLDID
ncbi:hypothetical protein DRQ25_09890 [Candidatus Fermentibacteria bacterium]|nr:MAG: hypothetical protein DRQ25_09890 [Candidatus Fermentibacteria bacterium]